MARINEVPVTAFVWQQIDSFLFQFGSPTGMDAFLAPELPHSAVPAPLPVDLTKDAPVDEGPGDRLPGVGFDPAGHGPDIGRGGFPSRFDASPQAFDGSSTGMGAATGGAGGTGPGAGRVAWIDGYGPGTPDGFGLGDGGGIRGGPGSDGGDLSEFSLPSSYTSGGSARFSYNVTVNFVGEFWTTALQEDFVAAADSISSFILEDVPRVFVRGFGLVDDIEIDAEIVEIDGSGNILGLAGPTSYRTANFLPATGIMQFDVADAEDFDAKGYFDDIVLHEMMHAVGFGTMWDLMGLVSGDRFLGENANRYDQLLFDGDGDGPLIETNGGEGTAGGHWDEERYTNELMTGFLNTDGAENYLSDMSIAALEDMGYDTIIDDPDDPNDLSDTLLIA